MYKRIIGMLFCTSVAFFVMHSEPVRIETNDGLFFVAEKQLVTLSETWKKALEFNNDQRGMQNTIKEEMSQQEIETILSLFTLIEQRDFDTLEHTLLPCDMVTIVSVLQTASYLLVQPLIQATQKIVVQKLKQKEELEKFCANSRYSDALCLSPEMERELAYLLLSNNPLFKWTQATESISSEDNSNICSLTHALALAYHFPYYIGSEMIKWFLEKYSITLSAKITELLSHDSIAEIVKHPTDFCMYAFVSSKGIIYVWHSRTDSCTVLDEAHSSGLIAWHPKSSHSHILANTSFSFKGSCVPTISIWDTNKGECLVIIAHEGFINDIAWHPVQENIVVSTNGETIYFFNTENNKEYCTMPLKSILPNPGRPHDFPQITKIRWQNNNLITRDTQQNMYLWDVAKMKDWYQCSFKQAMLLEVLASSLCIADKVNLRNIALELPSFIKERLKSDGLWPS